MRGEHSLSLFDAYGEKRFIPACAGNTSSISSIKRSRPVHPRMRGEHTSSIELNYKDKITRFNSTGEPVIEQLLVSDF